MRTIYLRKLAPWSWLVLEYISPISSPGHFLRAAVISRTTALVNWGACVHWWSSCSYRKCPQDGSTFFRPPLVPGATRSLRKIGFLVCELEWNVPEQTPKGLSLTSFSLKAAHKHPVQTNPFWVHSTLLRVPMCLGGCTLRKEAWAGTPKTRQSGGSMIISLTLRGLDHT